MSKMPKSTALALIERARRRVLAKLDAELRKFDSVLTHQVSQIDPFLSAATIESKAEIIVDETLRGIIL